LIYKIWRIDNMAIRISDKPVLSKEQLAQRSTKMYFIDSEGYVAEAQMAKKALSEAEKKKREEARKQKIAKWNNEGKKFGLAPMAEEESIRDYQAKISDARTEANLKKKRDERIKKAKAKLAELGA
jgi:hypothetical protein